MDLDVTTLVLAITAFPLMLAYSFYLLRSKETEHGSQARYAAVTGKAATSTILITLYGVLGILNAIRGSYVLVLLDLVAFVAFWMTLKYAMKEDNWFNDRLNELRRRLKKS